VSCATVAAGWKSGDATTCQRYNVTLAGACSSDGRGACRNSTACRQTLRADAFSCGSSGCRRVEQCVDGAPVSSAAQACLTDVDAANATTCADVRCVDYVRGWAGSACVRFAASAAGRCSASSQCVSQPNPLCSSEPSSNADGAVVHQCASSQCKKACAPYSDASLLQRDDVCHTNVVRALCAPLACPSLYAGSVGGSCTKFANSGEGRCDALGGCVALNLTDSGAAELANRKTCEAVTSVDVVHKCASPECAIKSRCTRLAPVNTTLSASARSAHYCLSNQPSTACASVTCTSLVKGWNGGDL
jgi:hypothetical protein